MTIDSKLIERIEGASGPCLVLDRDIALAVYPDAKALAGNDARISVWGGNGWNQITVKAYTASIDSARTLVPQGWVWTLVVHCDGAVAGLTDDLVHPIRHDPVEVEAATPALALCAAALRSRSSS